MAPTEQIAEVEAGVEQQAYARLRSYLSTLRKHGIALLAALQTHFTGQLLYSAFA